MTEPVNEGVIVQAGATYVASSVNLSGSTGAIIVNKGGIYNNFTRPPGDLGIVSEEELAYLMKRIVLERDDEMINQISEKKSSQMKAAEVKVAEVRPAKVKSALPTVAVRSNSATEASRSPTPSPRVLASSQCRACPRSPLEQKRTYEAPGILAQIVSWSCIDNWSGWARSL